MATVPQRHNSFFRAGAPNSGENYSGNDLSQSIEDLGREAMERIGRTIFKRSARDLTKLKKMVAELKGVVMEQIALAEEEMKDMEDMVVNSPRRNARKTRKARKTRNRRA
jgi:hypothetical protein